MEIVATAGAIASIAGLALTIGYFTFPRAQDWFVRKQPAPGQARTVVVIVYKENKVAMVKRRGFGEPLTWYFPSGNVSGADTPAIRAIEEVKEEIGITCEFESMLGDGRCHPDTKVFAYYVVCSYKSGEISNKDPQENEKAEWVLASEVRSRISTDLAPQVSEFLDRISDGERA